jgi:hypothetical protein
MLLGGMASGLRPAEIRAKSWQTTLMLPYFFHSPIMGYE